jgi:hypothetical protein
MEVLEGTDEHVLSDVGSLFSIRHHAPHESKNPVLISVDQLAKRLKILASAPVDYRLLCGLIRKVS